MHKHYVSTGSNGNLKNSVEFDIHSFIHSTVKATEEEK